eukprot:302343-Chlamydomonas_euryale.AAC.1
MGCCGREAPWGVVGGLMGVVGNTVTKQSDPRRKLVHAFKPVPVPVLASRYGRTAQPSSGESS